MPAPAAVIELVERFAAHRESYRSGGYKEAQLREEFVNPLFAALGWDVANAAHDRMVALVERMLDLHKRLAAAKSPDEKTRLEREIKSTDAEIDRLVYELYGLTAEEIAIVEGTSNA